MTKQKRQPRIVYTRCTRRKAMRNPVMFVLLALLILCLGFFYLGYTSAHYGHGYTEQERTEFNRLLEKVSATKKQSDKRAVIMDLWNISEADLDKPVILWKE